MINRKKIELFEEARSAMADAVEQHDHEDIVLHHLPRADQVRHLTERQYTGFMNALSAAGYSHPLWPVLTPARLIGLDEARRAVGIGDILWRTRLQRMGVVDFRGMDGDKFLDLLALVEDRDPFLAASVIESLREITPAQLRLLQVARQSLDLREPVFRTKLRLVGGVTSAADLDRRGFDLFMMWTSLRGFGRALWPVLDPVPEAKRDGFATRAQLDLIRALWAEWSGAGDEAALGTWLERFHHVSALRFVTAGTASKVIASLKAMKARRRPLETAG